MIVLHFVYVIIVYNRFVPSAVNVWYQETLNRLIKVARSVVHEGSLRPLITTERIGVAYYPVANVPLRRLLKSED